MYWFDTPSPAEATRLRDDVYSRMGVLEACAEDILARTSAPWDSWDEAEEATAHIREWIEQARHDNADDDDIDDMEEALEAIEDQKRCLGLVLWDLRDDLATATRVENVTQSDAFHRWLTVLEDDTSNRWDMNRAHCWLDQYLLCHGLLCDRAGYSLEAIEAMEAFRLHTAGQLESSILLFGDRCNRFMWNDSLENETRVLVEVITTDPSCRTLEMHAPESSTFAAIVAGLRSTMVQQTNAHRRQVAELVGAIGTRVGWSEIIGIATTIIEIVTAVVTIAGMAAAGWRLFVTLLRRGKAAIDTAKLTAEVLAKLGRRVPGGLAAHEARLLPMAQRVKASRLFGEGGHVLRRHVGKSVEWLKARIRLTELNTKGYHVKSASSFKNVDVAEDVLSGILKANKQAIVQWVSNGMKGTPPRLVMRFTDDIGTVVKRVQGGQYAVSGAKEVEIILRASGKNPFGWHIHTVMLAP